MLEDQTYRTWTTAFAEGSFYQGDWKKGSKILFLAADKDGKPSGMVSRIAESKPHEFISIEHLGIVSQGIEDTTSDAATSWAPAFENYTFKETDHGTELVIDIDVTQEYLPMFQEMWPKALTTLKDLAER